MNNGDIATIRAISSVVTKVQILGRVKSPGFYSSTLTLKEALDIAGGFNDPLYRKSIRDNEILILRKDENQFYALEFKVSYKESGNFNLVAADKIFVYENINYENIFSIQINGEVNKRGSHQHRTGMTVQDAINLAEGFTQLANKSGIIVTQRFTSLDNYGNVLTVSSKVNDVTLDYELDVGSVLTVLPIENVVSIEGNVYSPGLVTYSGKKSLRKYISLAGGFRENSLKRQLYVQHANGRVQTVSLFNGFGIRISAGDRIVVPVNLDPQDFDVTAFIADLATVLANIAAIIFIVDNNKQ